MSGTSTPSSWWESSPLSGSAPPPSPTQAATTEKGWWDSLPVAGPGEISPEINNVIDDPARAAPAKVIANASMFPNIKDRIPIYAKALAIPPSEFGTMGDTIVYRDPKNENQFIRVEPSVTGAKGIVDGAKRVGLYAAGSVGPAIPAVASIVGGALTRSPGASIAASGAGGGIGDVARQALGQAINGGNPTDLDWLNVAGQTALGAAGQGVAVGGRALFNRVPAGLASADEAWMRNPANVAAAKENADLLRGEGITGLNGAVTNRQSLLDSDRKIIRNAGTADPMRDAVRRINTDEVPAAAERLAGRISPDGGIDQAARRLQDATKAVIESPRLEANHGSREAYRLAQAEPDQWNAAMRRILSNDEMKGLYRSAATRAERDVTLRTPGAVSLPDLATVNARNPPPFEAWQYMRKELDAKAGAAKLSNDHNTARQMASLSKMLDGAIREVNPSYIEAQAINAPGQQITNRLREGALGGIAKSNPDMPAHQVLAKAFSPSNTTPTAIAEMRQAFVNSGQLDSLDSAFSGYVRSVVDTAQKTLASGETGNVAGKIHGELFSTGTKREAVAAALGGKNTPEFKQFAETMRAFEIASRQPVVGSTTATDLGQIGATASPTARAISGLMKFFGGVISPHNYGSYVRNVGDKVAEGSASKAAVATAQRYAAGPAFNGAALDTVRVMSPTLYGLLGGASRSGVGILPGLLSPARPEADWQPYQPPLQRP